MKAEIPRKHPKLIMKKNATVHSCDVNICVIEDTNTYHPPPHTPTYQPWLFDFQDYQHQDHIIICNEQLHWGGGGG